MQFRHEFLRLSQNKGLTEREIARRFDVAPSVVHYWLARDGRAAATRKGRPRATNDADDASIYEASVSDPFKTAVDIKREFDLACHLDTVRNRLKAKGLKCRVPARKPALTREHRLGRHAFASTHRHWDVGAWHRVVFSDEKIFRSSSRGALRVYRPRGASNRFDEAYLVPSSNPVERKSKFNIQVWMAFGGRGSVRVLHRVLQETLESEYYTSNILPLLAPTLRDEDLPSEPRRLVYMQDWSSIHNSIKSRRWLHENNVRVLWDYPKKAPDLNPVENVWAMIVRSIEKRTRVVPGTGGGGGGGGIEGIDQLWEYINDAFASLDDGVFDNLVASMPRRMRTVDLLHGGWTKY